MNSVNMGGHCTYGIILACVDIAQGRQNYRD